MTVNFTQKGIEVMKQAVAADNSKDYETALRLYISGIDYFMTSLKCEFHGGCDHLLRSDGLSDEKNERSKEMIRVKIKEYMDRVDYLKTSIANPQPKKPAAVAGAGGGAGDDDDDGEKKKLQGALEGNLTLNSRHPHAQHILQGPLSERNQM